MGFAGDLEDVEMEDETKGENLFEDHISFTDMVLGIKEGRYF